MKLPLSFYRGKNVVSIAKQLLGKVLVTKIGKQITSGVIVEVEAYSDRERGSHAYKGMTRRNEVMFASGGIAYVYLCYGVHEMFNVVSNSKGHADAILIRALEPLKGIETMMERSKARTNARITSGPGKLTKALGIDRKLNGESLSKGIIWIEDRGALIPGMKISHGPRIGIDYAGEDVLLPWRFTVKGNKWVSKKIG